MDARSRLDIRTKRVYETPEPGDGARILVDRVWPRGLTKEKVAAELWMKEAAPSTELRKWFGHERARWEEFKRRYFAELDARPQVVEVLLHKAAAGPVTLLYSARDEECNQAEALKEYLLLRRYR
jgi:Uncharacterized conserved protein